MKAELIKTRIDAHSGVAFELKRGQFLKVTDPEGEQVSELLCFKLNDPDEWLSSGRTLAHAGAWRISTGSTLFSNRSNPMLSIVEDSCGRHDFLLAPCSQEINHGHSDHTAPAYCHQILYSQLMGWDIDPDEIYTTFSIFMNVQLNSDESLQVMPPLSKAGDFILFEAEMDLVVALTACAAPEFNNGSLKPIDYEILDERF